MKLALALIAAAGLLLMPCVYLCMPQPSSSKSQSCHHEEQAPAKSNASGCSGMCCVELQSPTPVLPVRFAEVLRVYQSTPVVLPDNSSSIEHPPRV